MGEIRVFHKDGTIQVLDKEQFINEVMGIPKGQFCTVVYKRDYKTLSKKTGNYWKIEKLPVQIGVNYDHKKATIEARANGDLPPENAGLSKNTVWLGGKEQFFLYTSTTDKTKLRTYLNGKTESTYYCDGNPCTWETIKENCTGINKSPSAPPVVNYVRDLDVDHIIEFHCK